MSWIKGYDAWKTQCPPGDDDEPRRRGPGLFDGRGLNDDGDDDDGADPDLTGYDE